MSRVLVTGGAGYLGRSVVDSLARRPDVEEIVVYDSLSGSRYGFFMGRPTATPTRFVLGDILDERRLLRQLDGIDVVIHLAGLGDTPLGDHDSHRFDQVNNWGSAQVAQAIERTPSVRRAVYSSSVHVYGAGDIEFDTSSTPSPTTFYGVTKLRGEAHFERLIAEREVSIARCGNVYGFNPSVRFDGVVNRFVFDGRHVRRLTILGTGSQVRSLIEVGAAANALSALAMEPDLIELVDAVQVAESVNTIAALVRELDSDIEYQHVDHLMPHDDIRVAVPHAIDTLTGQAPRSPDQAIRQLWKAIST